MATYKDEAIVLHAHDLGEADRIISMLTAGRGLRRAVAKGVKRTASRFGARLEPFTHLKVVLHEGRNLDTVTQAEIVRSHASLRSDFERFLFGQAMLELVEKSLHENQNLPRLFDILRVTLGVMEGDVKDPALLLAAFQLKVCALIGYRPRLDTCLHCGRQVSGERVAMDPAGGGIVCSSCIGRSGTAVPLSAGGLELMRGLMGEGMASLAHREEDPRTAREVLGISFLLTEGFLERRLRSRRIVLDHLDGKGRIPTPPPGSPGANTQALPPGGGEGADFF